MRWLDDKPSADELRGLIGRTLVVVRRVNPLILASGTLMSVLDAEGEAPAHVMVEIAGHPFRCQLQSVVDLADTQPSPPVSGL